MIVSILFDSNVDSMPIAILIIIGSDKARRRSDAESTVIWTKPLPFSWNISQHIEQKKCIPASNMRSTIFTESVLYIEHFAICVSLVLLSLSGQCHQLNEHCA